MPFHWTSLFRRRVSKNFSLVRKTRTNQENTYRRFLSAFLLAGALLAGESSGIFGLSPAWAGAPTGTVSSPVSVLTLHQAIRLGLARNPGLEEERARIGRDQARSVEVGELQDPKIVLGEQYFPINFNMGASVLSMTTVGIRQNFPSWGKRALLRQSAVQEEKAARWNLEDKKALLVRNIRLGWLDLYQTQQEEGILRSIGALWEKAFQATLGRYRQGTGAESDVLLAQYQKDAIRDKMEQVRIREEKSLYRLMNLMHVTRPFRISPEEPHIPEPLSESVLLKGINHHPALESWAAKDDAQQIRIRSAEKDKIPAVSVEGDYSYFMGPNLITSTPNLFSVLLTFNLPVRPGERQDQKVAEKESELEILESDREGARQRLIEKIQDSEGAYRHLLRRTVLLDHLLTPEAERTAEAALADYATGTLGMERVLSAMEKIENVKLKALSVRVDRLKTSAELAYLSGILQGGIYEP
jgi:outer membrane protein TolC